MKKTASFKPYLYILPAIILFGLFTFYPTVKSFIISFYKWDLGGSKEFVGLKNFDRMLFGDNIFWIAIKNNLIYFIASLVTNAGFGLVLAAILSSGLKGIGLRGQKVVLTSIFLPMTMSLVAVGFLWSLVLNPDFGLLNNLLSFVGLGSLNRAWLGDPEISMYVIAGVSWWRFLGFNTILYYTAMQRIPATYYEAAMIDGANPFQSFFHITLPLLKGTVQVIVVLTIIGSLKVFDIVYSTTRGGPFNMTEVIATWMYKQGFVFDRMGYAVALAVVLFVLAFVGTIIYLSVKNNDDIEY